MPISKSRWVSRELTSPLPTLCKFSLPWPSIWPSASMGSVSVNTEGRWKGLSIHGFGIWERSWINPPVTPRDYCTEPYSPPSWFPYFPFKIPSHLCIKLAQFPLPSSCPFAIPYDWLKSLLTFYLMSTIPPPPQVYGRPLARDQSHASAATRWFGWQHQTFNPLSSSVFDTYLLD